MVSTHHVSGKCVTENISSHSSRPGARGWAITNTYFSYLSVSLKHTSCSGHFLCFFLLYLLYLCILAANDGTVTFYHLLPATTNWSPENRSQINLSFSCFIFSYRYSKAGPAGAHLWSQSGEFKTRLVYIASYRHLWLHQESPSLQKKKTILTAYPRFWEVLSRTPEEGYYTEEPRRMLTQMHGVSYAVHEHEMASFLSSLYMNTTVHNSIMIVQWDLYESAKSRLEDSQ